MARRPTRTKAGRPSAAPASLWIYAVPLAVAWLIAFGVYFFKCPLANNGSLQAGGGLNRFTLALLLPEVSVLFASDDGAASGLAYLPQRFDLMATAGFLAGGIWGLGGLLLRLLGLSGPGAWFDRIERLIVTFGLGLSAWSLVTLGLGLAGALSRPLFIGLLGAAIVGEVVFAWGKRRSRGAATDRDDRPNRSLVVTCFAMTAPFLIVAALGAMLPPIDFDVKEYHLGGPKEWFLDGRIRFLPHNVYTSFPFLTEMLSLSAMVVRGDWFRGALVGQLLLAGFLPLTAGAIFATGRRLFGAGAGLLGAVVYLTTPWAYRIAVIAYAEGGLTCYVALSLLVTTIVIERMRSGTPAGRFVLLAGLFAGSAMACKYPGVVQAVIPIGGAIVAATFLMQRERRPTTPLIPGPSPRGEGEGLRGVMRMGGLYALGVLIAVGPWLVKNTVETGNPVYPLLWTLFGGRDWDAELNAKWKAGHSAPHYDPKAFFADAVGAAAASDWQSLLVFGLAPLALLGTRRRAAIGVWLLVGYLYASWWGLTHRIDRFWVPMLPVVCVLAGAGAAWAEDLPKRLGEAGESLRFIWRASCGAVIGLTVLFNFGFVTSPLAGNPSYLTDLAVAARAVETPSLAAIERALPPGAKVLLVGEAEIFDARFPVLYNTVFDHNLFEQWTAKAGSRVPKEGWPLRPIEEIREEFRKRGVTHVAVNWREVLRYRTTYGFTPYVTRERFKELRRKGVLGEPVVLNIVPATGLSTEIRQEAERAFPALLRGTGEGQALISVELYPVVAE